MLFLAPLINQFSHELMLSGLLTIVGAVCMYPFRKLIQAYTEITDKLTGIHAELTRQRSNCLTTLQNQGEKQIELLDKACDTLEALHLGQVEMSGYIRARK